MSFKDFTLDSSRWSIRRLEEAEAYSGSPTVVEYGQNDMFDLPSEQWDMEKIQEQTTMPIQRKHVYGYRKEGVDLGNIEPYSKEELQRELDEAKIKSERGKKAWRDRHKRHKKQDEEEFSEIFIQKDSIFSDFRTEEDERATEPPQILIIE